MMLWSEVRALDQRRNELLSLLSDTGMLSDRFERYCGNATEMFYLINLGLVEVKRGRVYLTKNGRNRVGTK